MDAKLRAKWRDQKRRLKIKFMILTDQNLTFAEDKQEEMLLRLQIKLGKTKEQLQAIIAAL